MNIQTCPVCMGIGKVDAGFYNRTSECWTSAGGTEMCRSCFGRGYVYLPDESQGFKLVSCPTEKRSAIQEKTG